MKKKLLLALAVVFLLGIAVFAFTACDDKDDKLGVTDIDFVESGKVEDDKITIEVGTTVNVLDVTNVIRTKNGARFGVYEDKECRLAIPDKKLNLKDGENKFYVTVESGSKKKTYDLNIWKNFRTTIYYYIDGELFDKQEDVLSHTTLDDFRAPESLDCEREFLGWGCKGYFVEEKDKRFDAKIKHKQINVTLDANGGECEQSVTVGLGAAISLPFAVREGYDFVGWYHGDERVSLSDGSGAGTKRWMTDSDITLTAKWNAKSYKVNFVSNIKDVSKEFSRFYYYGSQYTVDYGMQKLGYRFLGWYKDGVKIGDASTLTFTPESREITIEKRWEYDVSLDIFDYEDKYSTGKIWITGVKNKNVTSLIIPDGVHCILDYALSGLSRLEELTLPFLGEYDGYSYSFSLRDLFGVVPQTLKKVTITGGGIVQPSAFQNCTMLEEVVLGEGVVSIGSGAFKGCSSLSKITVSDNTSFVGEAAFEGTPWYDSQGDGAIYIGKTLYKYKKPAAASDEWTAVTIKADTVYVTAGAFADSHNLFVFVPESVTNMGSNVFGSNTGVCCEALVKPNDWSSNWLGNDNTSEVEWGVTYEQFLQLTED